MSPRPQWSGETHPALAQVPRTPQQLQHLQRLQMQREQQQQQQQQPGGQPQHSPNQGQMVGPRPPVPCNVPQVVNQGPQNGYVNECTKKGLNTKIFSLLFSKGKIEFWVLFII